MDKLGLAKSYNNNTLKKDLPAIDHTGKLHGKLPTRKEWSMHSIEDLKILSDELKKSIIKRSEVNKTHPNKSKLPSHSRRLNDEINLKRDIDNFIYGK